MDAEWDKHIIKSCSNKFKILSWWINECSVILWPFSKKDSFFKAAVLQNVERERFGPYCACDIENELLNHRPSIKERAWFMGFFNAGAFFMASDDFGYFGYPSLSIDRGLFIDYNPAFESFFKRNSTIKTAVTNIHRKTSTKNFLVYRNNITKI